MHAFRSDFDLCVIAWIPAPPWSQITGKKSPWRHCRQGLPPSSSLGARSGGLVSYHAYIHPRQAQRDQAARLADLHHDVLIIVMQEAHHAVLPGGGQ